VSADGDCFQRAVGAITCDVLALRYSAVDFLITTMTHNKTSSSRYLSKYFARLSQKYKGFCL
jgi:hypothetical protein